MRRDDAAAGPRPPIGRSATPTLPFVPPLPLAHGDLSVEDAHQLGELKDQIESTAGFHCRGYKEKCLRRRIAVRMRARGVHTYAAYAELLRTDPPEYERLVDTLTINVSKFFRNPEVWNAVSRLVLPELYAMDANPLRAWSAGTASGEEAYTLRMVALDHAREHGHAPDRLHVLGTDIDRESLAAARRARYSDFSMTDTAPELRDRWFDHDGLYHLRPEAREHVEFDTLDLIRDPFPREQHLILCRNVIIYFERGVQETLFRRFHEALVPGGFLVLGKVEALFGEASSLFQAVSNRDRVFRKA